ncbi:hypothetical protein INT43_008609 [Umbelopsis isabellina]|uniref:Uncharacterized protein n=1 Tax=Mortierella isabellina TaxID=91625 RepID=A0A8H7UGQ1_MORIS|nr:hypothetical protein INT43_008609 [Umbelopsis isabellina]
MRVCLSALAAFLLATAVFAQEAGEAQATSSAVAVESSMAEVPAADADAAVPSASPSATADDAEAAAPSAAVSNSDFLMTEFDATPEVSTLELNQDFQTFNWVENSPVSAKSFVFELEAPAQLLLTDYKQAGDSFHVYDNGELIGATRKTEGTNAFAETPEEAVPIAQFSKAAFALAPGPHNITIEAISTFESGSGAVRLVPATEELMVQQQLYKHDDDEHDDKHDDDKHDDNKHGDKHWDHEEEEQKPDPVVALTRTQFVEVRTTSTLTTTITVPAPIELYPTTIVGTDAPVETMPSVVPGNPYPLPSPEREYGNKHGKWMKKKIENKMGKGDKW